MLKKDEKIKIIILMSKYESPIRVIREIKKEGWNTKRIPTRKTISEIFEKFKVTGSVHNRSKSGRPSISEQNNRLITDYFENTSSQSIREASAELSISYGSIRKVLKVSGYYPYKIKLHQHLEPEDFAIRKSMSEDILLKINEDPSFLARIVFSDESTFRLDGVVNRHNCRIWGKEPPNDFITQTHSSPKINVWVGLCASRIYGPFFFHGNLTIFAILKIIKKILRKCEFHQLSGDVEK